MQGNLSRREFVLHYLSSCLVPMLPFCGLKVQEMSDRSFLVISVAGEFPRHDLALSYL